ncbi:hypothetical protein ACIGO6_33545 [Streptomyces sp. NPDC053750]|uniref:hypothetical protein n=1 Tax=Streptomyces sp. NPDC053750 TaxID=3365714 RepID=UPI0037CDA91A
MWRFAQDVTQSVRPPAERLYDIRHWSEFERSGCFAARKVPELLAEDVRDFFLTRISTTSGSPPAERRCRPRAAGHPGASPGVRS